MQELTLILAALLIRFMSSGRLTRIIDAIAAPRSSGGSQ